jgi:hypothetical protein
MLLRREEAMPKDHMGFDRPWWWLLLPVWLKRTLVAREFRKAGASEPEEDLVEDSGPDEPSPGQ